ncbi:N-acetylglucosamine-binding protein GbpA [Pseudomonas sp. Fl5BN2]|uniref:N-acetylglucosamine-binding protein GbpA n=1 Tax=Pseudomonas sp. Fl5BN2 TaxID=2697652 RepID=UPI001376FD83|nr:N-acetylglucosamine-binding protein GbpA [Pseudomonas sp. Fl5BN2]NBF04667.1 N-acetylglucosamine-binding protein GbpA [Pseudomonas sp. Fl5BN2]
MITLHPARSLLKLPLVMAIGMAALASQHASAHGYIESPKSRAFMCAGSGGGKNANCGPVAYEPQSVEYFGSPGGGREHFPSNSQACTGDFRVCGPANGTIAAGGMKGFAQLNEQSSSRWTKNTIKPGPNTFTWKYTAGHATRYWQFYITKKDWNPNQPLTRDSFEMTPLLDEPWPSHSMPVKGGGTTQHTVNIPADRSGYHVVLATWKVHDNSNTFYSVVDLNIDNANAVPSQWNDIGAVQPEALKVGDKVMTRVFTNTEQSAKQVLLNIDSAELANENIWPFELAKKVNAAKLGYQMGLLDDKDQIVPNRGKNNIFVKKGSDISNVIIAKELAGKPSELNVTGMQPTYTAKNGQVDLHFNAIILASDPQDEYMVYAKVFDAAQKTLAYEHAPIGNLAPHFSISLKDLKAGKYDLVVVSSSKKGQLMQQTSSFTVKAEENTGGGNQPGEGGDKPVEGSKYDHVFPQGLSAYKAGTLVLQPKDGKTYKCKPLPYAGYCVQWKTGATQYEPGTGSHWTMAWDRQ